jgi:hypothetical protein
MEDGCAGVGSMLRFLRNGWRHPAGLRRMENVTGVMDGIDHGKIPLSCAPHVSVKRSQTYKGARAASYKHLWAIMTSARDAPLKQLGHGRRYNGQHRAGRVFQQQRRSVSCAPDA